MVWGQAIFESFSYVIITFAFFRIFGSIIMDGKGCIQSLSAIFHFSPSQRTFDMNPSGESHPRVSAGQEIMALDLCHLSVRLALS